VAGSNPNDFVLLRYEGFSLDVTPDAYAFTDEVGVTKSQVQYLNLITVGGLDSGVAVPVSVSNCEYSIKASATYTTTNNWVENGDQINVRHISAASAITSVDTVLNIGGVMATNGITHFGIDETIMDTYSTTTTAISVPRSGGGGGTITWMVIIGLSALALRYRSRYNNAAKNSNC